jgi:PST family polysaccharide transporter
MGAVVNVILNWLLIPAYAGVGAAVATVISYGIGSVFSNAISTRSKIIFILQIKCILSIR